MVAVAVIFLGAGTGVLCSTVNPFATGVASDAAGISISDGLWVRAAMFCVLVPVAIGYVLWYGRRISHDPAKSLIPEHHDDLANSRQHGVEEVPPLTRVQKWVLVVFGLAFAILVYGFIPWDDVWHNVFDTSFRSPPSAASTSQHRCSSSSAPWSSV
jgi:uncharacterized ion transporter superfamily protein YfcC